MMRTPKVTVAWCRDCRIYTRYEDIGNKCWLYGDCERTLIKRVGYICPNTVYGFYPWGCSMIHWTVKAMKECRHDAY